MLAAAVAAANRPLATIPPSKEKAQGMCLGVGSQTGEDEFLKTTLASGHSPEASHL